MKASGSIFLFHIIVSLAACTNSEVYSDTKSNSRNLFPDYSIWADESSGQVTCRLQFRTGGSQSKGVIIKEPGNVQLDGTLIKADSSKYSGVYYEINNSISAFSGKHAIVFKGADNRTYKEEFDFTPLDLDTPLEGKIERRPFVIKFKGLPAKTYLRLVITDTSFYSKDVNEIVFPDKGQLEINRNMLKNLRNGPVTLEIFWEEERPLRNGTSLKGKISLTYHLQRDFELAD